ncbi:hypothetical protein YC2023_090836 [Brassica napus]
MRGAGEETVAWRYLSRDVVPFAAMFTAECAIVGSNTLFKAATLRGLSFYVFVFYSYLVSTLLLLPLSFIFGRSKRLPPSKSPLFFKILLVGFLGFISQIAGCKGIEYSSPTLSSAISNLTPAFTFTLAVIFRMEQVRLRSSGTQAKIIGAVISISGALVIVLYKGPKVLAAASFISSSPPTISLHQQQMTSFESSWIIGGLLLASQYFLISIMYILQTRIMEAYPEEIRVVFFYNLIATLISAPVCFLAETDLTSWVLKPDMSLAAIIYSGVFVSLFSALTHTWGLHLKGPVYVSLFRPLSIAIAVTMGALFLGASLHLGSVIGSVILCFGFYTVMWGKARENSTKAAADNRDLMERGAEEKTVALRYFSKDVVPFAAMVSVECVMVGANTLFKAATLRGLSFYVYIFYSYVVATIVLLPLSLIFGRSRRLPSAKFPVFVKIFFLAVLGLMSGLVGLKGVEYSSPTLSSAISNLTPAFTFTLAIIFRMEQVRLSSSATQAKIIGTLVSISGALVVVLYKGPKVLTAASSPSTISLDQHLTSSNSSWMIGGLLLASQYFFISVWYILQVMAVYPEQITVIFFYNLFATLISAPVCFFAESNLTSWVVKPDISLAAIVYSGVLLSSFGLAIHTWGLHLKGPVYISLFKPLSIVIAVILGAIFLGDALYLGSVIGSVILSLGFYTVIWGKAREDASKTVTDLMARGVEEEVAWRYFCRDVVPFTAMVAVECVTVGANTLFKAATMRGLSFYVFVFYNYVIATLVLLPLSLLFRRSRRLPSAKSSVFFKIFLLALVGGNRFMSVVAGCKGLEYSSPTLASAISNLTPAFTFTLAIIFRMEQVVLRSSATQAKIIGTIVSMSGALVVVLYKGPKILASSTTVSHDQHLTISESSWIIGGLLIAAQYLLVSIWLILQTRIMEVYPEEINVVFLYNLCATLISAPVCLFATKDLSSFLLKPGLPLASVMFSGGLVSSSVIHTWGLHLKGPVYISLFKPLSIVIAVAMGSIFLGDALYLGSVVGSVILSLGFYTVIWGKSREDSTRTVAGSEQSPLLLTHTIMI